MTATPKAETDHHLCSRRRERRFPTRDTLATNCQLTPACRTGRQDHHTLASPSNLPNATPGRTT